MSIKVKRLVNEYEQRMLEFIKTCLDNNYYLYTQVGLSQICQIVAPINYELKNFLYSSTTVDCLITDLNFLPLLVIEFQSKYHDNFDAIERDRKKAELLKIAGIPLIYTKIKEFGLLNLYSVNKGENVVFNLFSGEGKFQAKDFVKQHCSILKYDQSDLAVA